MSVSEEGTHHLFVVRIWTDRGQTPPQLACGVIEHIPTGERQYFSDLADMGLFVTKQLSAPQPETGTSEEVS